MTTGLLDTAQINIYSGKLDSVHHKKKTCCTTHLEATGYFALLFYFFAV